MQNLYETIGGQAYNLGLLKPEIPEHITNNICKEPFYWQKEAFVNLLTYEAIREKTNADGPVHLMFNMATGTGKTLVMAGSILHYYRKGYRKFIFFVNQKNIIYKTVNNFIDRNHPKYLFADKIIIDEKTISIKKVDTFSNNKDDIEIILTTIGQLYSDIHTEKENKVVLGDFLKKDIVMLADEAHHLNSKTKATGQVKIDLPIELTDKSSEEDIEKSGWEHTVNELLLNKNGSKKENKNILLEFTATVPELPSVIDKYAQKIIYKFGLKEFLSAGYTKEINLLSSNLDKRDRILQALLFSWYRHKIALKNNIANFKPVILFRSKTIEDSKNDFEEFGAIVNGLKESDFDFLKDVEDKFIQGEYAYEQGKSRVIDLIKFIKSNDIKKSEIVDFIRDNFVIGRNCVITNSGSKKTKEEISQDLEQLLNNLEDKGNNIRAIFTVMRLTEGWDVLNLFDIVRLYSGRDEGRDKEGNRKAGSTTVSEIQLIGRGVRYYPFAYADHQKNKRKFDEDLGNEMRVLEELYYHSESDHRYIDELKRELKNKGMLDDKKIEKRFKIKKNFAESDFFKDVKIWKNEKIDNPNRQKNTLEHLQSEPLEFNLEGTEIKEQEIDFDKKDSDKDRLSMADSKKSTIEITIKDFEKHIFEKAVHIKAKSAGSILRFSALQNEVKIDSLEDFRVRILGGFKVKLKSLEPDFDKIPNTTKLVILLESFDIICAKLKQNVQPYNGGEFVSYKFSEFFSGEVRKSVDKNPDNERLEEALKDQDWYVVDQFYGTSEERSLVEDLNDTMIDLERKYGEGRVFLLRNEEQYKIYEFDTGRGFQPDFLLLIADKKNIHYQVFIEPKGDNLLDHDKWKNDFLVKITEKYGEENILTIENKGYKLIGLPLYNKNSNAAFSEAFQAFK